MGYPKHEVKKSKLEKEVEAAFADYEKRGGIVFPMPLGLFYFLVFYMWIAAIVVAIALS